MFYIVPLLIIIFSSLGIFFILWRRAKSLSEEGGDSLVYPEMEDAKFFDNMVKQQDSILAKPAKSSLDLGEKDDNEVSTSEIQISLNRKKDKNKAEGLSQVSNRKVLDLSDRDDSSGFFLFKKVFNDLLNIVAKRFGAAMSMAGKIKANALKARKQKSKTEVGEKKTDDKSTDNFEDPAKEYIDTEVNSGSVNALSSLKENNSEFDEQYWIDVLKQDSQSSFPYKKLGEIYVARGDFREARAVLRYALKLDPNDEETKFKLVGLRGKRTKRA